MRFAVLCPWCGWLLDVIPVEDDDWHAVTAWGYLAQKEHEPKCPVRRRKPPTE